jgi:hypothetical protein
LETFVLMFCDPAPQSPALDLREEPARIALEIAAPIDDARPRRDESFAMTHPGGAAALSAR